MCICRAAAAMLLITAFYLRAAETVTVVRVPDDGIQPQAVCDAKGVVHLLYYKGEAGGGDIFYATSSDFGATFSAAIRVNSDVGSAIAMGNIRGAHLALGKNGRVHVAWMGSKNAPQKGPADAAPMLYTRLDDAGKAFEPQRNVISQAYGLDGGGTVAADPAGNVYVLWHGNPEANGEINRRVFVVHSSDDGKTFSKETPAFAPGGIGVCGCCGMSASADQKGTLYALFRSATGPKNPPSQRDMYLLVSKDKGATFQTTKLQEWGVTGCPMSLSELYESKSGMLATWETKYQVYLSRIDPDSLQPGAPLAAPGAPNNNKGRKFPVIASNGAGDTIFVWTEGMAWQRGGVLSWQVYDKAGQPKANKGQKDGVPEWSLVSVFARPDGGFTIVY